MFFLRQLTSVQLQATSLSLPRTPHRLAANFHTSPTPQVRVLPVAPEFDEMSRPTGLKATKGIELLTWGTPNGVKAAIILEELKEAYGKVRSHRNSSDRGTRTDWVNRTTPGKASTSLRKSRKSLGIPSWAPMDAFRSSWTTIRAASLFKKDSPFSPTSPATTIQTTNSASATLSMSPARNNGWRGNTVV